MDELWSIIVYVKMWLYPQAFNNPQLDITVSTDNNMHYPLLLKIVEVLLINPQMWIQSIMISHHKSKKTQKPR